MTRASLLFCSVAILCTSLLLSAQVRSEQGTGSGSMSDVSPARGIVHQDDRLPRQHHPGDIAGTGLSRRIDGAGNNLGDPEMGAAHTQLRRLLAPDYADGLSALAGPDRLSPREISNLVSAQPIPAANALGASDFLWQWGQFLDHDIDLTDGVDPPEPADIDVPDTDLHFDPDGTIAFNRSIYDPATGTSNPRQQLNEITAWIDASNVYGSDEERANALRTLDGSGRLKTSGGDLLPFNVDGLPNAGGNSASLFLAGDVRANEQVGLTAMHTLFVREHNRLVGELATKYPNWTGDRLYQHARKQVGAQMQVITYREFLPALLGPNALSRYRGYDPNIDARISNIFSTAVYRFGHSALSSILLRLDADGTESVFGHLPLRDAFFSPRRIIEEGGIDPVLLGLANQACEGIDVFVVDDVRNFLFGDPRAGGFDLVALNIQRGRDHGLPGYNDAREQLGLARAVDFSDVTTDPELQARLAQAYPSVNDMDAWVGGLAEDRLPGAHVGEFIFTVMKHQFEVLRDGDRFWYTRVLTPKLRNQVERTRLSDIIKRNTGINRELQEDVFHVKHGVLYRIGRR